MNERFTELKPQEPTMTPISGTDSMQNACLFRMQKHDGKCNRLLKVRKKKRTMVNQINDNFLTKLQNKATQKSGLKSCVCSFSVYWNLCFLSVSNLNPEALLRLSKQWSQTFPRSY